MCPWKTLRGGRGKLSCRSWSPFSRFCVIYRILAKSCKDKLDIAENIKKEAKYARVLFIWTDCDREGEHIGSEVRDQALLSNPRIEVKRARFSNTERG